LRSNTNDTIVARATPAGTGGIAVVRLSGPAAFNIAGAIFIPTSQVALADMPARMLANGTVRANGQIIDHCIAVRFVAPHSFTGDDVVEFHLHGNTLIVDEVIDLCVGRGARLATAGEFSRRAFMNGKIDLTQVEALADVIAAESEQALFISQRQLHGDLRRRLDRFRERLLEVLALLELELDFVEDGYHFASIETVNALLDELRRFVGELVRTYQTANRLRHGPRILLLGRPNAGKSSLFNALLGYSRALVSPMEGTTRDYLEERISYGGVQFRFVDTAGLRSAEDSIEAAGVARAYDLVALSDHVFYLIDGTRNDIIGDELVFADQLQTQFPSTSVTSIVTKGDLVKEEIAGTIGCSIYDDGSIRGLLEHLSASYRQDLSDSVALVNQRQYHLLKKMGSILEGIDYTSTAGTELLSADLRALLAPLSELTGEVVNDDILTTLFSSFCIGK
jgi:tRNA modification GTPase